MSVRRLNPISLSRKSASFFSTSARTLFTTRTSAMAQSAETTNNKIGTIPNDYRFYSPLSLVKKEIRVACLMPGGNNEPIRCFLRPISLDDEEISPYEALSYCWGSLEDTNTIELYHICAETGEEGPQANCFPPNTSIDLQAAGGGTIEVPCRKQKLSVTSNLVAALQRLRHPTSHRFLWIDAVCINQGDFTERIAQVAIMRQVYEGARQTLIWLGESDEGKELAMSAISSIASFVETHTGIEPMKFFGKSGLTIDMSDLDRLNLLYENSGEEISQNYIMVLALQVLAEFFAEPWFRRVWVLQEVGAASRAVLRCGPYTVGWGAVLIAALWQKRWASRIIATGNLSQPALRAFFRDNTIPTLWIMINAEMKLSERIFGSAIFASTDHRDRLYALIGTGKETKSLADPSSILRLNYQNAPEQAFAQFTRGVIEHTGSLDILSTASKYSPTGKRQMFPEGPSWTPDFDITNDVQTLLTTVLSSKGKSSGTTWNASNGMCVVTAPSAHEENLSFYGYVIDSVNFQSAVDCESSPGARDGYFNIQPQKGVNGVFPSENSLALQKILGQALKKSEYPTGGDSLDAFIRTLRVDIGPKVSYFERTNESVDYQSVIREPLQEELLSSFCALYRESQPDLSKLPSKYSQQISDAPDQGSYEPFLQTIHLFCNGRCFFTTETGLMGLCPVGAEKGDLCVVLFGGAVPYILRRVSPPDPGSDKEKSDGETEDVHYEFIGECYVHGKMDGSMVRDHIRKSTIAQLFQLI